jgi:hypothetical protein
MIAESCVRQRKSFTTRNKPGRLCARDYRLKAADLKPSLSVLLPVQNAQANLQSNVQRLLDVLPELSGRFELLIVDDGSTDATWEVAYELARDYPQIKVARQATSLGWAATVAKQASKATGEFLMIHCGGAVEADEIVSLWRLRPNIMAPANKLKAAPGNKSWRVDTESTKAERQTSGKVQVTTLLNGLCIHARARKSSVLMLKRQQLDRLENSLAAVPRPFWINTASAKRSTALQGKKRASELNPSSFLSLIKSFTLGE